MGSIIKLNVGGTLFTTSVSTLTSIKGTFFDSMFSGRWEPKKDEDGCFFIDRDPIVFRHILNFLRDHEIDLEQLSTSKQKSLLKDSEFYQIQPLILLLNTSTKSLVTYGLTFIPGSNYILSNNNRRATKTSASCQNESIILGSIRVSSGIHLWFVKILKTKNTNPMIGVVPHDVNRNQTEIYNKCGWYFSCYSNQLYSGPPFNYEGFVYNSIEKVSDGHIVTVKLDMIKRNISFIINGTDYGIAYNNIPTNKELSLCVILFYPDDIVELVG